MHYASERNIAVTPRELAPGFAGMRPVIGGIVLCLSKMDKILEIDKENYTATVEPGVMLATIHQAVEPMGFLYAPDPGEKTATIGGNISTNAGACVL